MYAPEAGEKSKPRATPGHEHIIAIITAALIFIVVVMGPLVSDKMHEQIEGSAVQNSLRNLSSPFFDKPQATKQKAALNNSRYNYALSSCGAKVLFSSRGAAHSSSILNSNMDSYMIVDCTHTKEATPQTNEGEDREPADDGDPEEAWVIIELCQAIRTDGIEISNFELFSAQFKNVTVYGSFNSPGQDSWVLLGNFITSNVLQSQKFPLLSVWCRYIKIVVHSHWGNERFCTISSIKVFGNSLVEDMITWQEENTNKLLLEGETNPSQQQIQPEPHTKAATDRQNDDDDDDDTTLNNLSETDDNTTLQHSVNITDDSDDGDEDEILEIIVPNLTIEEEDTESINEDEDSNSTLIHTEDKKEAEKNNSEQNSTEQERTEAEQTYDSRTRCINYLSLFDYDLSKNYIRSSTTNTTFFSTCEKYAVEEIFFLNETKANDTVKKDTENNTETDKQKENMTKKLFTPQLPFDKLKMKYSTLDTKVKALNEIISSMNATLYKLKYKNKLLKVETRMNNTLMTKKFDTLVSELLINTTKTTNIIASINDEVETVQRKLDFYEENLEILETNMDIMNNRIAKLIKHFMICIACFGFAFIIMFVFLIIRTHK